MIGCKVMRTLASVEFEIILILGLPCCLSSSSSSVRCLENVEVPVRMSTLVFVDPEISTQADGAQSPRVHVPFLEDPYEAIRHAYLLETEIPKSPHTIASPTTLLDSIPPTRHAEDSVDFDTTARMAVRVPHAMSPGLSASIAKVAAMSNSAFCKRFSSSYESSPSSLPPDLPSRKRYRGMSELVEDEEEEEDDKEEDDEDEDEEIEESSYSDRGDEVVPEGQQRAALVVETTVGEPLGLGYEALRRREIALREGRMPSVFEVGQSSGSVPEPERPERVSALTQPTLTTWIDPEDGIAYIDVPAYPPPAPPIQIPPSLEWSSGSLHVSPAPSIVPSPISSPMIPLIVPSPVAPPTTAEAEGFLTELGAQVEMQGGLIHDHTVRLRELSPALFERYDRDIRELFTRSGARPVLALESWAGQRDAKRASMWHAISDTQMVNESYDYSAEERRAQLDLAKIVDSIRRGQEPRRDV
ncbi:hypothetical protein Tco_0680147 [Tanacetum coccineum]|uniref:Uncharacterized protein n=1 Tax=Tanacetum coccineum TaxID=301880 RepID=A0ABQ4XKW1_9ASTR